MISIWQVIIPFSRFCCHFSNIWLVVDYAKLFINTYLLVWDSRQCFASLHSSILLWHELGIPSNYYPTGVFWIDCWDVVVWKYHSCPFTLVGQLRAGSCQQPIWSLKHWTVLRHCCCSFRWTVQNLTSPLKRSLGSVKIIISPNFHSHPNLLQLVLTTLQLLLLHFSLGICNTSWGQR